MEFFFKRKDKMGKNGLCFQIAWVRPARLPSIHGTGYEIQPVGMRQCSHRSLFICAPVQVSGITRYRDYPEPAAQQHNKNFVAKDKVNPFNTKINQIKN